MVGNGTNAFKRCSVVFHHVRPDDALHVHHIRVPPPPPHPVRTLLPRISAASTRDTVQDSRGDVVAPIAESQTPFDQRKVVIPDTVYWPRGAGVGMAL